MQLYSICWLRTSIAENVLEGCMKTSSSENFGEWDQEKPLYLHVYISFLFEFLFSKSGPDIQDLLCLSFSLMRLSTESGIVEHLGHNTKIDTETLKSLLVKFQDLEWPINILTVLSSIPWILCVGAGPDFRAGQVFLPCQSHAGGCFLRFCLWMNSFQIMFLLPSPGMIH